MGSLTAIIDEKRYGRLLAKTVPRVITTEDDLREFLEQRLIDIGGDDLGPFTGKSLGDGFPDSTPTACDNGDLRV